MTTSVLGDLAKSKGTWEWREGMRTLCGVRLFEGGRDYLIGYRPGPTRSGGGPVDTLEVGDYIPDFQDAATIGCLVDLVRGVYRNPNLFAAYDEAEGWPEGCAVWRVMRGVEVLGTGKTEVEAWVQAFVAAP